MSPRKPIYRGEDSRARDGRSVSQSMVKARLSVERNRDEATGHNLRSFVSYTTSLSIDKRTRYRLSGVGSRKSLEAVNRKAFKSTGDPLPCLDAI